MSVKRRPTWIRLWRLAALLAALAGYTGGSYPMAAEQSESAEELRAKAERRIAAAREIATAIRCRREGDEQPLPLAKGPLSAPEDYVADYRNVTTWAWGDRGRPQALLCLSTHRGRRVYELLSLCTTPLDVDLGIGQSWTPTPGWSPARFTSAPAPAGAERLRLAQMKALARRFSGHEFGPDGQRHELRLVSQPIYRYPGPSATEVDGALFLFSLDLNPETLLVVELAAGKDGQPYWQYFLQRLTVRNVAMSLDGRTAWEVPEVPLFSTEATAPFYVLFHDQAPEAVEAPD
jgi:hypothetical protein